MSQLKMQQMQEEIARLQSDLKKVVGENRDLNVFKHQLEAIFNNAPAEIYLKDSEGRYLKINRQFEKIFGVKNDDLIGKLPFDAHDPELAQSTRDQDLAVLTTGRVVKREEQARLVIDDQVHTLLTIKFPVFNESGEIDGLGAVVTDITEQKQAEGRFIDIVNTLDGIIWESQIDVSARTTFISEKVIQFLGFTVDECLQTDFWDQRFHPQDRHSVRETIAKYHAEDKDSYQLEYRLITRSGKIKYVRDLVSIKRENGKVRWLRGIIIDITAQKQAEIARHEAEERFRRMFVSAPIGLVLGEIDGPELIELNPAYCQIVGRNEKEIKSVGWQSLIHQDDLRKDLRLLKKFKSGEIDSYSFEKRYVRPDGQFVWVLSRICHI
ncbi:MAG: PAS domain S-box protein, partial [Gammaproteobacteria bacterium]|nr:PAS domain S-box protein [Gammaproteobacteria bacterium]